MEEWEEGQKGWVARQDRDQEHGEHLCTTIMNTNEH